MNTRASAGPLLRLVGADGDPSHRTLRVVNAAGDRRRVSAGRAQVARENRAAAAAGWGSDNPARELSRRVEQSLEGGRAALIRPEVRRRLMVEARELGVKTFDASLVIALVQERAREGEVRVRAEQTASAPPGRAARDWEAEADRLARRWLAALGLACFLLWGLIAWVQS
jgi:hypothetical protein